MNYFKVAKEFGFGFSLKYGFNLFLYKIFKRTKYNDKRIKQVYEYLKANYMDCLPRDYKIEKLPKDFKVWVFWYQGYENMPDLVKTCIETIKNNFKNNEVVFLTKDNFLDYAEIPDFILKKVEEKNFSLTHLSDILRATLLAKYGGVWVDATMFLTEDVTKDLLEYPFYSTKIGSVDKNVAKGKWCTFFMSAGPGNPIFVGVRDVFFKYCKTHNLIVNYYLIDIIMLFLYENMEDVRKIVDDVPPNSENIYKLAKSLFDKYDPKKYNKILSSAKFFKLTYKFKKEKAKKPNTIYKKLIGEIKE